MELIKGLDLTNWLHLYWGSFVGIFRGLDLEAFIHLYWDFYIDTHKRPGSTVNVGSIFTGISLLAFTRGLDLTAFIHLYYDFLFELINGLDLTDTHPSLKVFLYWDS